MIGRILAAGLVLALPAGCQKPVYHETTCDFLASPDRYANSEREFGGQVRRTASGNYSFHSGCDRPVAPLPLTWRRGVVWEEGVFDESGDLSEQRIGGGIVTGTLRKMPDSGRWQIEATDYRPLRFDL